MYGLDKFILYMTVLLFTAFVLFDKEKRKKIFCPNVPPLTQAVFGLLIWLCTICVVGVVNITLFHSFSLFQFTLLDPKNICIFLAFQLLVAVTEEILFRGYLTELGKNLHLHWVVIALVSSSFFGIVHWVFQQDIIQLITALLLGFVFSLIYQKSKRCSIYSLIVAHFLYDIAIINVSA